MTDDQYDAIPEHGTFKRMVWSAVDTTAPIGDLWREIESIGGDNGWYALDWLLRLRLAVDRLLGGVGMRRGIGRKESLAPGDIVDCYRVVDVSPERRLTLLAEMKLPGDGVLEFRLTPRQGCDTRVEVGACFEPSGCLGEIYWTVLLPLHALFVRRLAERIVHRAVTNHGGAR